MSKFKNSGEFATTWVGGLGLIQGEEIVRCRDCKFKDEPWNCAAPYFVEPDGYCAWGRKKDK